MFNVDFSDITPLLLAKREPAQAEYELALADFERARRVLEAAKNTLGRINNMLEQCGYVEEPQPEQVEQAEQPE